MPSSSKSSSGDRSAALASTTLRQRLVWLTVFRTLATSLLLGAFSLALLNRPGWELSRSDSLSFAVIGLVYVSTLIYGVVLRKRAVGRIAAQSHQKYHQSLDISCAARAEMVPLP